MNSIVFSFTLKLLPCSVYIHGCCPLSTYPPPFHPSLSLVLVIPKKDMYNVGCRRDTTEIMLTGGKTPFNQSIYMYDK